MIQRLVYTALQSGLDAIAADLTLLDDLFSTLFELGSPELATIKTWFTAAKPKVYHGYARADYQLPFYSIVLQREGEVDTVIGDDAGMVLDPEDGHYLEDVYTAFWETEMRVLCYSENPDATSYLYEIAKSILIRAHDYFIDQGVYDTSFSGMDLAPDPRYIPDHLFVRAVSFAGRYEFQVFDRDSKLQRAFRVGGIHVDKSGSSSDVGGVKTLVTPYSGTDED